MSVRYRHIFIVALLSMGLISTALPAQAQELPAKVAIVYFQPKAVSLDKNAKATLDAVIPSLAAVRAIRIDGFVQRDTSGATRPGLSQRRADSVARYLRNEFRKRGWNIDIEARGKGRPQVNPTAPWARRAEVYVTALR
jgi:outer membrane protein OmpA-like peptidoglycan-associated protein